MSNSSEDKNISVSSQRIAIGVATLVTVMLTIAIAFLLAKQDQEITNSFTPSTNTATMTAVSPLPTATSSATTVPPTPTVMLTQTPIPTHADMPTATDTPLPMPTDTSTATHTPLPTNTLTPLPPAQPKACQKPSNWVEYEVQRGDTLATLSSRVGKTVYDLQQVNCLNNSTLQPRQIIYLPFSPPTSTPTDTPTVVSTSTPLPKTEPSATFSPTPAMPIIQSINPASGDLGQEVRLTILGVNFGLLDERGPTIGRGFKAELHMVQPKSGTVIKELKIAAAPRTSTNFEAIVPADLPEGCYDFAVINPNERIAIKERAYTNSGNYPCSLNVTMTPTPPPTATPTPTPTPAPPRINTCSPSSGQVGQEVQLICTGNNFESKDANFKVVFQKENEVIRLEVLSNDSTESNFRAIIPASLKLGIYDLIVTNPNGKSDIKRIIYEAIAQK